MPGRPFRLAVSFTLLSAGLLFSGTASAASPLGEWLVNDGSGHIRILDCGGSLWGVVTWESNPGLDDQNPDPTKRNRPILGMPVLLDLKASGSDQWWGQVYNSGNGKTYSGGVRLKSPDVLRITGCVLGILCGGQDWTRVAGPPPVPDPGDAAICTQLAADE
jgi:uncharacterized protein (DUF2147 family)